MIGVRLFRRRRHSLSAFVVLHDRCVRLGVDPVVAARVSNEIAAQLTRLRPYDAPPLSLRFRAAHAAVHEALDYCERVPPEETS